MRYCRQCILPDTRPNLKIGEDGLCNACRTHAQRARLSRPTREREFAALAAWARDRKAPYDCLIPVSGGKDSTWQVLKCLQRGLKPLAVTWRPPGRTKIGQQNLDNLISLGVDHIDFSINPKVERRFLYRALTEKGTPGLTMHMAIFSIPLRLALQIGVPLVIWGENSALEYGGAEDPAGGERMDSAWIARFGVTHGTKAADWTGEGLSARDLWPYTWPTDEELDAAGVRAVFLGYFFPWDPRETFRLACEHGFTPSTTGARTGVWEFADIDDDFISLHHFLKWHKFGFTRSFDNLSVEIRNGRLTREQALAKLRELGDETPYPDIARFCRFLEITPAHFFERCERFRNREIWRDDGGVWRMDGYLIDDFDWAAAMPDVERAT